MKIKCRDYVWEIFLVQRAVWKASNITHTLLEDWLVAWRRIDTDWTPTCQHNMKKHEVDLLLSASIKERKHPTQQRTVTTSSLVPASRTESKMTQHKCPSTQANPLLREPRWSQDQQEITHFYTQSSIWSSAWNSGLCLETRESSPASVLITTIPCGGFEVLHGVKFKVLRTSTDPGWFRTRILEIILLSQMFRYSSCQHWDDVCSVFQIIPTCRDGTASRDLGRADENTAITSNQIH